MAFWAAAAPIIGGALSGLLGGGPKVPGELKPFLRIQKRAARGLEEFARSVPLSTPLEQASLAQQRALLGEQLRSQRNQLYNLFNTSALPKDNLLDFMNNITNQQTGTLASTMSQNFLEALRRRQQALMEASQLAGSAAGTVRYQEPGSDIGGQIGQLLALLAYQRGLDRGRSTPSTGVSPLLRGGVYSRF